MEFQAITRFPGNGIHVGYHYNDIIFLGTQSMNLKFKYEGTDDFTETDVNTQLLVLSHHLFQAPSI